MELERIRNTSIIAHIDHGKSTLADRMLELTGAVEARDMRAQYLDSMDLERERGITIKLQSVRLDWDDHVINLIDTPGHVDFGYEVSRSLAACESVILVVDAAQGIEAQTLANCYLAMENALEIVACLNKIDLPAAEPDRYAAEIENVLGIPADDILRISAKTGEGVPELLDAVIGLPANIFYGTTIPTCILVLKKQRENPEDILFVDASQHFEKVGNQNQLRPEDIERIVSAYRKRERSDKFSHVAKLSEIEENDYNLNMPRYVDTFEEEEPVDLAEVSEKLVALEKETGGTDKVIAGFCEELNIKAPF